MAKHWHDRFWSVALLAVGGLVLALSVPHLVSAYHTEAAGRAMDDARLQDIHLASAHQHLQKAVRWVPNNAQAYRLLGQVYLTQGDLSAAGKALARYRELRPASPLGFLALAEFHTEVEARRETLIVADLLAALSEAEVQTGEARLDTSYPPLDPASFEGYVGRTAFGLPPDAVVRPTLYMHPPSSATYTLKLPSHPSMLHTSLDFGPRTSDVPGDGTIFEVLVDGDLIHSEHVKESMGAQDGHELTIDLEAWEGQAVALTLRVSPAPSGTSNGQRPGWVEPLVVHPDWLALKSLTPRQQIAEVWDKLGMTTTDLIRRGEAALEAGLADEASVWFKRASRLDPSLRDPWYHLGQSHEDLGDWQEAIATYEHALSLSSSSEVSRSRVLAQLGDIYYRQLVPPQLGLAKAAYGAALDQGDFGSPREMAWVHARLGQVNYTLDGDATGAEALLLAALRLAPEDAWLHIFVGDFYREEERIPDAIERYESAIERDPSSTAALTRLKELTE